MFRSLAITAISLCCWQPIVIAHGGHEHDKIPDGLSWAQLHMLEEHHVANFDAASFFQLHDFDNSHTWTEQEILRTYGIDESSNVPQAKRAEVANTVLKLMDYDKDGTITLKEFLKFHADGHQLPDFGLGPGHHGDDEYEYEVHHFEKYHSEDSPDSELNHPEDIEHFKHHEQLEKEAEHQALLDKQKVVVANIPAKYRTPANQP